MQRVGFARWITKAAHTHTHARTYTHTYTHTHRHTHTHTHTHIHTHTYTHTDKHTLHISVCSCTNLLSIASFLLFSFVCGNREEDISCKSMRRWEKCNKCEVKMITAVVRNSIIFWRVRSCRLVENYLRDVLILFPSKRQKCIFFRNVRHFYQTARCYFPEGDILEKVNRS